MKNKYETHGNITTVYDSKGRAFIIDTDKVDYVGQFKWFVDERDRVRTTTSHLSLHRYLLGNEHESIDHINRNRLDNRLCNLRACSVLQNNMNRGVSKNNKSGFKGVVFNKSKGRYKATIGIDNKKIHIGYYDTAEEASEAYKRRAADLFGDYAPYL